MSARVLVVDDIPPNVKLLEARLAAEYYHVVTASNGVEALEAAQANPPDIVLLDVMMPGMDGFEVCRRLKANPRTRDIPVVMVTALSESEDRVRGLEAGADDFLTKPVNDMALYARIRSLVRLKMAMDEWRLRQTTGAQLGIDEGAADPRLDSSGDGRVLIVEDQTAALDRFREALAVDRHAIETAADRETALTKAQTGNPDLVVVSLQLASSDGLRICADLRSDEATRHMPILALIENGGHMRLAKALDLGVNDYLIHPIDRNELLARCRTQVRRRRYHDRLRANYRHTMSLALSDSLTGLHNRRYAAAHIDSLIGRATEARKPLSLLMIDIDFFKTVNDTHGHGAGDEVLRAVAGRLSRHLRAFDTLARWGGEEFVAVMPDADARVAASVAERLRIKIDNQPIEVLAPQASIHVSVSIGVATTGNGTGGSETAEQLLRAADEALYEAKRAGRNRIMVSEAAAGMRSAAAGGN